LFEIKREEKELI